MHLDLSGKTAVVTGASSGIGLATVEALSAAGARRRSRPDDHRPPT